MGRGQMQAGIALLALCLVVLSSSVQGAQERLLVNEERLEQGQPSMVHVVIDPPPGAEQAELATWVTVQGPGSSHTLEPATDVRDGGSQLVTMPWTPSQAGNHTLQAHLELGGHEQVLAEERVLVPPASSSEAEASGWVPSTAPGTVQWAIAFGLLFVFTRASLERREPRG